MKISELIARLQELQAKHGDKEVELATWWEAKALKCEGANLVTNSGWERIRIWANALNPDKR